MHNLSRHRHVAHARELHPLDVAHDRDLHPARAHARQSHTGGSRESRGGEPREPRRPLLTRPHRMRRMAESLLVEEPAPHVGRLTLNRPDQLNAMTVRAVRGAARRASPHRGRALAAAPSILTGAGRGFCAGLDLARLRRRARQRRQRRVARPAGQPAAHVAPDPRAARTAPAGDRRGERARGRLRAGAGARMRHPLRGQRGSVPRRIPQHRRVQLRHGDELAAAAADRRLAQRTS